MTPEEMQHALGEEMVRYREMLWKEPEDAARKLVERRKKLFADESLNKLEFRYADDDFVPDGTPLDHVLIKEHAAYVTHMVPVDGVRDLVPHRFTLNSIIHDMDEWSLVTTRHERFSKFHPWRGALSPYEEGFDVVSYYTYVTDRNTGERVQYVYAYYCTPHKALNRARSWWSFPVHPFGGFESDVVHDGKKFTNYSFTGTGSDTSRGAAVRLDLEDTGYDARKVKSFAGFQDAESALVFLTNTHVSTFQQLDYLTGRSDSFHDPLPEAGKVTIARVKVSEEEESARDYSGITRPDGSSPNEAPSFTPPEGVYPWVQFWDLMRLNHNRRLHSALLFKGPLEVTQFMPMHVYDEQLHDIIAQSRWRRAVRIFLNSFSTRQRKTETRLSEKDYENLWRQGKYT
eukprot:TRINITY_DN20545_c0_g2_i1.p1 TRINITY_DN20545_c0_g2~~TRINITY_DN20545_c0_g2_i1.p1  ORF type:complete len:444 (+),score=118.14 TRINITY_DN20545_c0_g2_i1:130-1332(+)